jgi:sugar lactone lactonase YvrE
VIGGVNSAGTPLNDVWSTTDGRNWTPVSVTVPFIPARGFHQCVAFNGSLWVMGGQDANYNSLNDVWSSSNGQSWTKVTSTIIPWTPRFGHMSVAYNNQLFVIGGETINNNQGTNFGNVYYNDVYHSADGANWTVSTYNANFAPRSFAGVATGNGQIWLTGGESRTLGAYSEAWYYGTPIPTVTNTPTFTPTPAPPTNTFTNTFTATPTFTPTYTPTFLPTPCLNWNLTNMNNTGLVRAGLRVDGAGNIYELTTGNLLKYDPNGNLLWTLGILGNGLALDSNGNIYVAMNQGVYQYEKLSPAGVLLLTSSLPNASSWIPAAIAVDSSNNVYLTGNNPPNARFTKINSVESVIWDTTISGTSAVRYLSLAVDSGSNVYAAGVTTASGVNHIITTKVNSAGTVVANDMEEAGMGIQVALDPSQNPYVACAGGNVIKYNTSLQLQKDVYFNGFSSVGYSGLTIDGNSNVYLNGTILSSGSPVGSLLLRYDPNWNVQWEITNSSDQGAGSVALDGQGNIIAQTEGANNWANYVNTRKFSSSCQPTPTPTPCNNVVIYSDPLTGSGDLASNDSVYTTGGGLDSQYTAHLHNTSAGLVDSAATPATDDLVLVKNFNSSLSNYTVEYDVTQSSGAGIMGIVFREQDSGHFYSFQWNNNPPAGTNNFWEVEKHSGASVTLLSAPNGLMGLTNNPVGLNAHFKVVCNGVSFKCYVNVHDGNGDELVCDVADATYSTGGVGIRSGGLAGTATNTFSNLQVSVCVSPTPTPTPTLPPFCYVLAVGGIPPGSGHGQFQSLSGVAVDTVNSHFYASDSGNQRVQQFSLTGTFQNAWGTSGSGNLQFNNPQDLAVDSTGNIYVVDTGNNRVQVLSSLGAFVASFGTPGSGNGQFNAPSGIALDSQGNIYVVDSGNNRIQKFNSQRVYQTQWGTLCTHAATDGAKYLYVTDPADHLVRKYDFSGNQQAQWGSQGSGPGQFLGMNGIAVGPCGWVYVTDAGNWKIAFFDSTGNYKGQQGMSVPYQPAFDGSGNLYVALISSNLVGKYSPCGLSCPTATPTPGGVMKPLLAGEVEGLRSPTPTITPSPSITPTSMPNAASFVVVAPNISRGREPIKFLVNLDKPEKMDFMLFSVSGEKIFEQVLQGNVGVNTVNWNLQNQLGGQVASGLYIYMIEANDGTLVKTQRGKVAVLH